MKTKLSVLLPMTTAAALALAEAPATQPTPVIELKCGDLSATVYPPDSDGGHYRGSRFDWSGMIGELRMGTYTFWNEWNQSADPLGDHDNAVGPAMEFGMEAPEGYESADIGEGFVKIGVGVLMRVNEKPYFFRDAYPILDHGSWKVLPDKSGREVTFIHSLSFKEVAYIYQKRVALSDEHSLTIECRLWNTGRQKLASEVYAHNFYRMGDTGWRPGTRITFDTPVRPGPKAKTQGAVRFGDALVLDKLDSIKSVWAPLEFESVTVPKAYSVQFGDSKMDVDLGFQPCRFVLYGAPEVLCLEPFYFFAVEPGRDVKWSYTYRFSTDAKR